MSLSTNSQQHISEFFTFDLDDSWARALGRPHAKLQRTVAFGPATDADLPMIYSTLAEARLRGKRTVAYRTTHSADPLPQRLGLRPLDVPAVATDWRTFGGTLDQSAHLAFEGCSASAQDELRRGFVAQIEAAVRKYVGIFYSGSWAHAVRTRTLGRQQYVNTLQNMHQYVRFTTRLLGRAVACSHTTRLRAHYAAHLRGEINHELQLERDLEQLGESTDFLRTLRYANPSTRTFMSVEQSLVSFELDPVMFAACPIVAESFSANLDAEFLESLRDNVRSYGIAKPAAVTTFFSAHVESDAGEDGHWAATKRILEEYLPSEIRLGEFLSLMELAAQSFTASFNDSVDELGLFSTGVPQ